VGIAKYLVSLALTGRQQALTALELWSANCSPSEIERLTGLTRTQIRGYLQRVYEKTCNINRARVLLKALLPLLKNVDPVVVNGMCTLCGARVWDHYTAFIHVKNMHMDIVEKHVSEILRELRRRVAKA
jgi:DNA-binding CsgD family transcriptional regulator